MRTPPAAPPTAQAASAAPVAARPVVLDPPVVRGRSAGDPPPAPVTGARRLVADPAAVDAVAAALGALHGPDGPGTAPVVLAATDYCVHAADAFAARCDDPARRLRPSDSVALEPSGLLQGFTALTGWQGPGYVVADPEGDGTTALRFARGLVESGRTPAAYLCEVLRRADTGAFWAVATRLHRGTGPAAAELAEPAAERPAPDPAHRAARRTTGLDPATRARSAVLRAYTRHTRTRTRTHEPAEEQQP
ncbi:hypothetical protein [Streptomyces sp. NPDC090025]|uniref:hypothetical protein n=1 Tax=Streptomyces sp. NPDC090025 TaxID=3365922 RepID=UPI0038362A95